MKTDHIQKRLTYIRSSVTTQFPEVPEVEPRDYYKELRALDLSHDKCEKILDWIKTL